MKIKTKKVFKITILGVGLLAIVFGIILYHSSTKKNITVFDCDPYTNFDYMLTGYSGEHKGANVNSFLRLVKGINSDNFFPKDIKGKVETKINESENYIIELFDENGDHYIDKYYIKPSK